MPRISFQSTKVRECLYKDLSEILPIFVPCDIAQKLPFFYVNVFFSDKN